MYQSFRHGFATNSSSCHSIILAPKGPSPHWTNSDLTTGEHLENVTLMSAENKAIVLARCLEYGQYNAHDMLKLRAAFAKHGQQDAFDNKGKTSFPLNTRMFTPPKGVKSESWVDMILDPDTSIHVHSDEHTSFSPKSPLYEMGDRADMSLLTNADMDHWTFKQDGDAIVGFHQETGMKFRWSPTPYTKSTVPELVDVKITDYCAYGCAFCYQGSTKNGGHAPFERIVQIFDDLAEWGVFEVALGGGEPMDHPQFFEIMRAAQDRGLAASFTTFDKNFDVNRPDFLEKLDELWDYERPNGQILGAIGVSVHSSKDVDKLVMMRKRLHICQTLVAQTVVGAAPMTTLERLVDVAIVSDMPLLLLGYKHTGRGVGREKRVDEKKLKTLLERAKAATLPGAWTDDGQGHFQLSVDTAFLDNHGHLLDELNVPVSLRTSPEGKFSMYVDAVTNTCAPSSYATETSYIPYNNMKEGYPTW